MPTRSVRFSSGETWFAGDLVLPGTERPYPALTLLHGASYGERKYYRIFADRFARAGVASLIFDRRGHGESDGPHDMDLFVLAADAEAAFRFVASQPEIDPQRCGLWGYSNGAWVASLAASRLPHVAFLLLTGASGMSPARAEVFRRTGDLSRQGIDAGTVAAVERAWTLIFDYISTGARSGTFHEELAAARSVIEADPDIPSLFIPEFVRDDPELDSVPRFDRPPLSDSLESMEGVSPGMALDPISPLRSVKCPVLVVQAELDANIAPVESLERFKSLAAERAPGRFRVEVIPGANHEFSGRAAASSRVGQVRSEESYMPGYLDIMAEWLASVTGSTAL